MEQLNQNKELDNLEHFLNSEIEQGLNAKNLSYLDIGIILGLMRASNLLREVRNVSA